MNALATAVVVIRRTFAAPRERVFRAWTEPEQLKRWFAPTDDFKTPVAEVDLRVGGRYRLGLLRPPGGCGGEPTANGIDAGPTMKYVGGTYEVIQPFDKLVFTWAWESSDMKPDETRVTVEFFDRDGQTEVVLTHERLPHQESRDQHTHGWNGCLNRLGKTLQETHPETDARGPFAEDFQLHITLGADPSKVYEALTEEAGLKGWWTADADVVAKEGSVLTVHFGKTVTKMRVDRLVPGEEVVWTCVEQFFNPLGAYKRSDEWVGTKMFFRLRPNGEGSTHLDFTHQGLTTDLECYEKCNNGWTHCLTVSLKQLLETGKGRPYQPGEAPPT